jgi:ketosteroid isomerase-like protein
VALDIGIATARALTFPESFPATITPAAAATPSAGADIRTIEAQFAAAASGDLAAAYRSSLMGDARLHRNERSPFVGRDAIVTFMSSTFERVTWAVLHAEAASSGDLAFTAGSYDAAAKSSDGRPGSHERGFFVRVWHRAADGTWKIAFETNGIR